MSSTPDSFSGPPLNLVRPMPYDHADLLPQIEKNPNTPADYSKSSGGHGSKKELGPWSKEKDEEAKQPIEHQQQTDSNVLVDHFPPAPHNTTPIRAGMHPRSPSSAARTPTARAQQHTAIRSNNNCGHRIGSQTARPSTSPAVSSNTSDALILRGDTPSINNNGLRGPHALRVNTASGTGRLVSAAPGHSFILPPTSPSKPLSRDLHHSVLRYQTESTQISSNIDNHDMYTGAFAQTYIEPQHEQVFFTREKQGRAIAQQEAIQRIDALIRAKMDQTVRLASLNHLNILDALYTNANGVFANGGSQTERAGSPNRASVRVKKESRLNMNSRDLFDPMKKLDKIRKIAAKALEREQAEKEEARRIYEARKEARQEMMLAWHKEEAKKRAERARIHNLYLKLKQERLARIAGEKKQREQQEKEDIVKRNKQHEKVVAFIQQEREAQSEAYDEGKLVTRAMREAEKLQQKNKEKRQEEARWEREQAEWKQAQEAMLKEKEKEAKLKAEKEAEADREKKMHSHQARKDMDERIMAHILNLQDEAREKAERKETEDRHREEAEKRDRERHGKERDRLAEEARKKRQEREEMEKREAEEKQAVELARAQALKDIATKHIRETMQANSPRQQGRSSPFGGRSSPSPSNSDSAATTSSSPLPRRKGHKKKTKHGGGVEDGSTSGGGMTTEDETDDDFGTTTGRGTPTKQQAIRPPHAVAVSFSPSPSPAPSSSPGTPATPVEHALSPRMRKLKEKKAKQTPSASPPVPAPLSPQPPQ